MVVINKRYLLLRTVQSIFMIWVTLTFLFFLFRLMPGDYTSILTYRGASPETVAAIRAKWGLDDPLYIQYIRYVTNMLMGDPGISLQSRIPVIEHVRMGIFHSFILVAPGITFAYIIGSFYGLIAGMNRGSWIERYGIVPIIFVGAFPSFFLAIVLVIIFAGWLGWFPTSGLVSVETRRLYSDAPWWRIFFTTDFLWHYSLPFLAVVLRYLYLPSMIMRTSVVETMGQNFHFYQRVTGLPKSMQLRKTAKHASLPVITLFPVSMTRAIGGLVLIEIVFNWPGIGFQLVEAVLSRDYPVLMFVFFLIAVFIILANFVVDILYGVIDPRVSLE